MAGGEIATELLVATGRFPQTVIQVSEPGNREPASLCEVAEEERERNGVRSAGEAHEHTRARRAQRVPSDGAANLLL